MSSLLLGAAFAANVPSQSAKLVLIKLVDCCDDNGRRIWPSIATLAQAAMCHPRHVKRVIRMFCDVGLLRMVRAGGRGAGSTACYEMDVQLLRSLAGNDWQKVFAGAGFAQGQGDDSAADGAILRRAQDEDLTAGNGAETGGCETVSHAHDACDGYDNGPSITAVKGDMMSPLNAPRVTWETNKGDMMCHPTPQEEPLNLRERARGREGAPAGLSGDGGLGDNPAWDGRVDPRIKSGDDHDAGGQGLGEAGAGDGRLAPTLAEFLKLWPNVALDSQKRIQSAWAVLEPDERALAVAGIRPYLALQKSDARTLRISGATYLDERRWTLIEAKQEAVASQRMVTVAAFSKDWWHVFLGRIAAGRNVGFMREQANRGQGFSVELREIPSEPQRAAMKGHPATSETGQRWLAWLAGKRLSLDVPATMWLQLPGEWPPGMDGHDLAGGL